MAAMTMEIDSTKKDHDKSLPYPTECHSTFSSPHVGPILAVRFSHTHGDYLLSAGQDRLICLWNPAKAKLVKAYEKNHGREVNDIVITQSNEKFASVSGDKVVMYWDTLTGSVIRRWRGHEGSINSCDLNEDDSVLITGAYDQTVKLWDIRAFHRDPIQTLTGARDSVTSVRCKGKEIAAASMDGCIRVWDVRTGKCSIDHIAKPLTNITWSQDGECLLVTCLDNTRKLFDKSNGSLLNTYLGAPSTQYSLETVFDHSDAYVIGGDEDGAIHVWDLVTAKEVYTYHPPPLTESKPTSQALTTLAIHPTKNHLAAAGADGQIRYWT